ncbi:MAG: PilZ domain-containing protein [Sphingomicrobium sp.]
MSFHTAIEAPRRTRRTRVLMTGTLVTPDGSQKVTVRDISRTGAQVLGAKGFTADCDAIFRRGSLFAAARVAWVSGDEAGLKFYRELSEEEIDGSLPASLLRGRR